MPTRLMKSKIMANADATAGQLRRLVLEISATFSPVTVRRYSQTSDSIITQNYDLCRPDGQADQGEESDFKRVSTESGGSCRLGAIPDGRAILAPGMQHHRDKSADGGYE